MSGRPIDRRRFLAACRDASAAVAFGSLAAFDDGRAARFSANPFPFGIASGDPAPDGVVLWTRLDRSVLQRAGVHLDRVRVGWEIADDEGFRQIVRSGTHLASPELGHSVHVEVDGLRAGRPYWYRFNSGGETSEVGRTRTAPGAGESLDRLQFAFVSCQSYENGYFTAFRWLAADDPDLVVHLGDYIYEVGGMRTPVRPLEFPDEVFTVEQYRARYEHYKLDPDLQAAHAKCPWIVTPDDHEVSNDYAGAISQYGMPADEFLLRRAAAYQAYYEFTPLRRTSLPAGPNMRLFRNVAFGRMAEFHVLDTRQYRSNQPCGGRQKPRCADALSPTQQLMGAEQERWLTDGLRRSRARWNIIANQVMMAQLALRGADALTYSMDHWDGYVHERQRVLDFLARARPSNPIVITGDIHNNWVADLKLDFDDPSSPTVGAELVGTSISTGGDGDDSAGEDARRLNPHIRFFNNRRGYVRCTLTRATLTADFRTIPYVTRPDAPIRTQSSFVVENGKPGAVGA